MVASAEIGQERDDGTRRRGRVGHHRAAVLLGRIRRLAEEDFAQVRLQQERIGHAQAIEQANDVAVEERALAAGFDGYITKPIDVRTFPAEVAQYLGG